MKNTVRATEQQEQVAYLAHLISFNLAHLYAKQQMENLLENT